MTATEQTERGLVLIVEDDEDSRYVYKAILEDNGFEVATATSGDDGLRLAQQRPHPQVILMDVSIPGMDGWSVTSRLKADPDTAGIPLIIITAHAFPEDLRRAEKVGCDAFLTKPCEPRHVLQEVLRMLEENGESRRRSSEAAAGRRGSVEGDATS